MNGIKKIGGPSGESVTKFHDPTLVNKNISWATL
jgi:hypothetical protein